MDLELLKSTFSLPAEITMTVIQSIIAAASLFLLYKTIRLQNKANETQANILVMEMKAKRAEYMPSIEVLINSNTKDWVHDGHGGIKLAGTKRKVNIQIIVKENILTNLDIYYVNPDNLIFKKLPTYLFTNCFYKPSEKIEQDIFEYDVDIFKKTDIDSGFMITITYEDMIGNRYEQKTVHNLSTNESEQLPLYLRE